MKMYRLRGHWVNAYLKDVFCAGMITSQRSESINSFFDVFVNSNTKLVKFVQEGGVGGVEFAQIFNKREKV